MKLGWLCDSILKTAQRPSPISTTPAFSPGPCTTYFPSLGRRFRCTRLDLYEQCSLHITLKIPSSVMFGSRPRIFWMRAYSSGVRPCSAATCGVTLISVSRRAIPILTRPFQTRSFLTRRETSLCGDAGLAREAGYQGPENHRAIRRPQRLFHRSFRVRHQPEHVAFAVADP